MENEPSLKTADLLKKGKYGFYKQVEPISNIYGEPPEKPTPFVLNDETKTPPPTSFNAFKPVSKENHFFIQKKSLNSFENILHRQNSQLLDGRKVSLRKIYRMLHKVECVTFKEKENVFMKN